jgi:hypothetical protein
MIPSDINTVITARNRALASLSPQDRKLYESFVKTDVPTPPTFLERSHAARLEMQAQLSAPVNVGERKNK